jgi:hypothetical protein
MADLTTCPFCGVGAVPLDSDQYRRARAEGIRQEFEAIDDAWAGSLTPKGRPRDPDPVEASDG